jgi:hypothetical protein
MHDWHGINDKRLQPCSELFVLDKLRLDVVPAGSSHCFNACTAKTNARKIAKAFAFARQTTAIKAFEMAPLGKVTNPQTSAGGLRRVTGVALRLSKTLNKKNSRWSNTLLSRAQVLPRRSRSALLLPQLVYNLMVVEHQMRAIGHEDAGRPVRVVDVDSLFD